MEVTPFNFISVIAIVLALGALGGHFMNVDDQDERDDTQDSDIAQLSIMISEIDTVDSETVKDWVNSANEALIKKDSSFETRIKSLEDKPTPTATTQVFTLTEKNQMINEINSLKSKMTTAERDIEDLEDEIEDSSSSSSGSRNIYSKPSCIDDFEDNTSRIVTIDSFRDTELDEDVEFEGVGQPREQVELWICQPGERLAVSGGNIVLDSDGEWYRECPARICAGETGDHVAFLEIIDNGDLTRIMEYEVER